MSTIKRARRYDGADALRMYAQSNHPDTEIPFKVYFLHNKACTALFDKSPKTPYHFIMIPRAKFEISKSARSTASPGAAAVYVPTAKLENLRTLATYEHALQVLLQLEALAKDVSEMIKEDMQAVYGRVWPIQIGFHANESMAHLHCHVMSQDFLGNWMKKPTHWNSFNPHRGFFLHLNDCIQWAKAKEFAVKIPVKDIAERIYKDRELRCHRDDCNRQKLPNMDSLRRHLQKHFDEDAERKPDVMLVEDEKVSDVDKMAIDKDGEDEGTVYDSGATED